MTFLKVVILGAPGCGKTALVKQFVTHSFPETHVATEKPEYYYPSIFADNSLFELRITDLPPIVAFPKSTIEEWTLYQGYGLRSANAFLLILDITSAESFKFAKSIKEQWQTSGLDTPFVMVSNKWDLVHRGTSSDGKSDMSTEHYKKELANAIKKQWKCPYVECSAKYNWNVTTVFKEVVTQLEKLPSPNRYSFKSFNGQSKSSRKRTCPFL
ncbi:unnamed protein product [Soboliphyme baturini]|uniref:Ras-like protein family member 10B n=1 Tax=Soboliphyme baturini TaxID=241478 RepID=A0A183J590_9BILA|nr:unnamed protein product [Soboliphyme baturini]